MRLEQVLTHLRGGHPAVFGKVYTKSVRSVKLRAWIQCMPEMQYI
jgi:hypothetical protein